MQYKVNDEYFDNVDEALDYCIDETYHWDDDDFEDWVNDTEDSVTINGCTYYPYTILEALDTSELEDLHEQFCDQRNREDQDEARWELRNAHVGDEVELQAYTIYVVEDDEEDCSDTDGDMTLDELKQRLEEAKRQREEELKEEDKVMSMFQIIGG